MYGWRAVVGIMLPSSCTVYEQEFLKITKSLDGVIGCSSRLKITSTDAKGLIDMNVGIEKAAEELATLEPDIVIYMCTSGSFLKGNEWEQEIRERIGKHTKAAVITTAQAVIEALGILKMSDIAMWTPYDEDVTLREIEWLRSNSVNVRTYGYGDISDNLARGRQHPELTYSLASKLDRREVDGLFISCANIRTIEVLAQLEADLRKPVVSASQATTWLALREAGVGKRIDGYGSLLEEHWTTSQH